MAGRYASRRRTSRRHRHHRHRLRGALFGTKSSGDECVLVRLALAAIVIMAILAVSACRPSTSTRDDRRREFIQRYAPNESTVPYTSCNVTYEDECARGICAYRGAFDISQRALVDHEDEWYAEAISYDAEERRIHAVFTHRQDPHVFAYALRAVGAGWEGEYVTMPRRGRRVARGRVRALCA